MSNLDESSWIADLMRLLGIEHQAWTCAVFVTEEVFSKGCEVTLKMEMLGWVGTALIIVAYVPQIRHLYIEKCAWGISISTWLIWLAAGALLLSYCVFRNDTLFTFVQVINITAILATIILARRSNKTCPYHLPTTLTARGKDSSAVRKAKDEAIGET